ncbi:MAG: recombinase family protein [Chloroflexota bacterium]
MPDYIPPPASLPPGSLVWSYLRDSGGMAQEQSVPQQRAEIEAFCNLHGLVLAHVFADVAKSGGSDIGRDAFQDMIDLTGDEDLRPAGLLIWNFARFARDLEDSSFYKATLRKRGMVIHSLTDPIPEGTFGRVIETIIDIANEEKRRQTGRDAKRALTTLVKQGYSAGGSPPRGYIAETHIIGKRRDGSNRTASKWVPDPATADLVKLAFQLRAEGRSYTEIQEATNKRLYNSINCFATFFSNVTYLGVGKCGALEVPDHHEALIDAETWAKVQKIQEEAQKPTRGSLIHPRRISNPSLLSGIAFCIECGAAMYKDKSSGWACYICGRKKRQGRDTCPSRQVNAALADAAFVNAVLTQVLTTDFVLGLLGDVRALVADTSVMDREIAIARRNLADVEQSIGALFDMIELSGASRLAAERLRQRESDRDRLRAQLAHLEAKRQAANLEITPDVIALALAAWQGEIKNYQKANDTRSLKAFLVRFVQKVELGYNFARIHYTYPMSTLQVTRKSPASLGGTSI